MRRDLPMARQDRVALLALAGLVVVGIGLRVLLMRAQSPGFISSSDSSYYLIGAHTNVFVWAAEQGGNPWPAGYPAFLGGLYRISEQLSFVTLAQHALGVGTALLWFSVVRRVAPALWGLLPAAVVLLAGPQLFLEHAPLAEPLFAFLIAAMTYCAVLALERRSALWGGAAGLLAAAAACVRVTGMPFVAIVPVWLLLAAGGDVRRRLTGAVAAGLAAALLLGTYLVVMKHETGFGGPMLTRSGQWGAPPPTATARVSYLERVRSDLGRYWSSPNFREVGGYNYDGLVGLITRQTTLKGIFIEVRRTQRSYVTAWYRTATARSRAGLFDAARGYERRTRLEGVPFVALLLLAVIGIPFALGRRLAVGVLLLAIAVVTLLVPVLYVFFDARYVIPGYGVLAALAALGGASLLENVAAPTRDRMRNRSRATEPAKSQA